MCLYQTPGRRPPPITGRFVNTGGSEPLTGAPRSDFMAQSLDLSLDVCPGLGISPLRTNIWLSFCGLQSESRLLRRLCHAMPNHRPGEVNPKQQLPFCCRSPCESRDCCAAVAVPSASELPSSLMLIQYIIRART